MMPRDRLAHAREDLARAFLEFVKVNPRSGPEDDHRDDTELDEVARLLSQAGHRLTALADRRRTPWRRPVR